jgi:hypothetical protein
MTPVSTSNGQVPEIVSPAIAVRDITAREISQSAVDPFGFSSISSLESVFVGRSSGERSPSIGSAGACELRRNRGCAAVTVFQEIEVQEKYEVQET